MSEFISAGYELAVVGTTFRPRQVIEVYPHVALLRLLRADYRVAYKIGRIRQYWPDAPRAERLERLRTKMTTILDGLQPHISDIQLELPRAGASSTQLKQFEDALDGVICGWIGTQYLERKCTAYGDQNGAIWVPTE
jgi:predicted RNase H-like nuclease